MRTRIVEQFNQTEPQEVLDCGYEVQFNFNIVEDTKTENEEEISGWSYVTVIVSNDKSKTLDMLQREAEAKYFEYKVESLVVDYPQYERDTFNTQEAEARGWKNNNNYVTPLLDSMAQARGIEKSMLVDKVIEKADMFKVAVGTIIGEKQKILG